MTNHHTLADEMFGAKTQEELKAKAEEVHRSEDVNTHIESESCKNPGPVFQLP